MRSSDFDDSRYLFSSAVRAGTTSKRSPTMPKRELEDGSVRIAIDRDDVFRSLHTDIVLHGSRDTDGDIEPRRDRLPGLSYLLMVRPPTGIHHRA